MSTILSTSPVIDEDDNTSVIRETTSPKDYTCNDCGSRSFCDCWSKRETPEVQNIPKNEVTDKDLSSVDNNQPDNLEAMILEAMQESPKEMMTYTSNVGSLDNWQTSEVDGLKSGSMAHTRDLNKDVGLFISKNYSETDSHVVCANGPVEVAEDLPKSISAYLPPSS